MASIPTTIDSTQVQPVQDASGASPRKKPAVSVSAPAETEPSIPTTLMSAQPDVSTTNSSDLSEEDIQRIYFCVPDNLPPGRKRRRKRINRPAAKSTVKASPARGAAKGANTPAKKDLVAHRPVLDVHKDSASVDSLVGVDVHVRPSEDFIVDYIRYADRFETPTAVHEAVAMSLVAMAANGKVFVDVGEIRIPLDFWVYIISGSGTGKNTITKPARVIVEAAGLSDLMHNESFGSAPQMEEYFSKRPDGWMVNAEMGQFMAKFSQNQFQGALEWLANLYDELAPPPDKHYREKAEEEDQTPAILFEAAPRISFLGMSSRSWFLKYADRGKATGGFLPRWIPVVVDDSKRNIPRVPKADASLVPPLAERLKMVSRSQGMMDVSGVAGMYDDWYVETSKRFKAMPDQELVQPFWHRHRNHLWKLAAVYELATTGQMKLGEVAMRRAMTTCRVWEENIRQLTATNFSDDGVRAQKIIEFVHRAGAKGCSRRDVFEHMNESRRDIAENRIVVILQREKLFAFKRTSQGGRPARFLVHREFVEEFSSSMQGVIPSEWRDFIA